MADARPARDSELGEKLGENGLETASGARGTLPHLQAQNREGKRERMVPTERAAKKAGSWGDARLQCNLQSGMFRGC